MRTSLFTRFSATRALLCATLLSIVFVAWVPVAQAQYINLSGCEKLNDIRKNYPIVSSDLFDVVYIDGCLLNPIWNDHGTEKPQSISFWRPALPKLHNADVQGFWYLGSYLHPDLNLTGESTRYATFVIKPKQEGLIVSPTDYELVWEDSRSNAKHDVSLWELKCPSGYVSLGLIAVGSHSKPSQRDDGTEAWWQRAGCVRQDLTYALDIYKPNLDKNDSFWASSGTKAADVALFGVERVKRKGDAQNTKSNTIIVPPATFWAKKDSYDPPSKSKFRGLLLPIKPVPLHPSSGGRGPTLTKPTVEDFAASSESTSEKGYSISAFLVNDGYYNSDLERLLASPEYYVYRTTKWKPVDGGLPCPWDSPDNCVYHYNVSKGTSETTTWNNSIGIAFSQSLEMETSFKPLGVGAGANLTLGLEESYSHEFGGDEGTSTEKGTEREFPVSPGTFAVAFESESTVEVYRKNDTTKNSANLVRRYTVDNDVARVEIKTFPLQKEKEEDGSEGCQNVKTRDLVECGLPAVKIVSFPKNTEIKSASGKHYLILTKYGSLEVRNGDVGRLQHAHVWSVDQKHSEVGSHKYPIGSVWFEDGRLCAVASRTMSDTSSEAWNDTKHPTWCSMPLEDATKDALLEIDEEGNLRVVDADGEVIWNSKYDEAD